MYEIQWPRLDADFRRVEKGSEYIIEFKNSENIESEFLNYAVNFHKAGNLIADYLIPERDNGKKDSWFFPMVYLYRQALELILKSIAFKSIKDMEQRKEYLNNVGHNLNKCFDYVINNLNHECKCESIEWLEKYLNDITYVDRESDVFRYPFSNSGIKFFEKQVNVNLACLKTNMNTAFYILKDIYDEVDIKNKEYSAYKPIFLISGGDYFEQSSIGWKPIGNRYDFYPYVKGYLDSGDYIRDIIFQDKKENQKLFLPMCYLYRNSVELLLKEILIQDVNIDYERAMRIITRKKHSVLGIWNTIKSEIEKCSPSDEDTTVSIVETYIKKLQNIDSCSDKFRYPVDKRLKNNFNKPEKYDIKNMALCFKELITFLECVDGELSERREWEKEMESYYEGY